MFKLIQLTVFFQAVGYLSQALAFFLFAKTLGAQNLGILTVFIASGQIIALSLSFGLPGGINYFVGKDRNYFFSVVLNCFKIFLIALPVLGLFSLILPIGEFARAYSIENYIPYLLIYILLFSSWSIFQLAILSLKKYLQYNLFAFGTGIILFGFSFTMWLTPQISNKTTIAIIAYLVAYGTMFIYGTGIVFIENNKIKNQGKKQPFWGQFKIGFRVFISHISALLLFRLDLFFVGYFLTLEQVGIYSLALFSAEIVTKTPEWSASILIPMVASNEEGNVRRTLYLFYSAIIFGLLLGLLIIFGILTFSNFISVLVGKDFKGVEICLLLLLPRVIMQSGGAFLAANLAGKGYPWYHPLGCSVSLVILVLLDIVLIPIFGIEGAALANSFAYGGIFIIFWIGFHKYNRINDNISLKTYLRSMRGYLHGLHPG